MVYTDLNLRRSPAREKHGVKDSGEKKKETHVSEVTTRVGRETENPLTGLKDLGEA